MIERRGKERLRAVQQYFTLYDLNKLKRYLHTNLKRKYKCLQKYFGVRLNRVSFRFRRSKLFSQNKDLKRLYALIGVPRGAE